jgi:3-methyladenine DNA glycosylase/8-oxoguanine DNA glycosylase
MKKAGEVRHMGLSDEQVTYLRIVAEEIIEGNDARALCEDERDELWEEMTPAEREHTGRLVKRIFGAWLD